MVTLQNTGPDFSVWPVFAGSPQEVSSARDRQATLNFSTSCSPKQCKNQGGHPTIAEARYCGGPILRSPLLRRTYTAGILVFGRQNQYLGPVLLRSTIARARYSGAHYCGGPLLRRPDTAEARYCGGPILRTHFLHQSQRNTHWSITLTTGQQRHKLST